MEMTLNGTVYAVEKEPRSIFDINRAGVIADNGNYYLMYEDENRNVYGIHKDDWFWFMEHKGRKLHRNKRGKNNGVRVRAMTFSEERRWDWGEFDGLFIVDLWGNMRINADQYLQNRYENQYGWEVNVND